MENYIDLRNNKDYEKLIQPAQIIKNGGIVVFPTETVYGIGVNGLDDKAVKKLYKVKKRPMDNPISLLVDSVQMIESVAKNITQEEYALIQAFMPGPLTIILQKKDIVPNALKLIQYVGYPIATPSANISGKQSGICIKDIMKDFGNCVNYYIDEGNSKIGKPSTIVKIVNKKPYILRKGDISKKQIIDVLKQI